MILEEATKEACGYYARDLKPHSSKLIVATCELCGKFRILRRANYHTFCGSCIKKGKKGPNLGKQGFEHSAWKGGNAKCVCEVCGKTFPVRQDKVKNGNGKYCSHVCANTGDNNPAWKGGKIECICLTCGKMFFAKQCRVKKGKGKYCSLSCATKGKNHPNWKGGISFEPYCIKFNNAFKEYIRAKFGYKCFLCPTTQAENGRKLDVHHVNYNKNCGCERDLTCQFVPLCIRCHRKTNFNRNYWQKCITNKLHSTIIGWGV